MRRGKKSTSTTFGFFIQKCSIYSFTFKYFKTKLTIHELKPWMEGEKDHNMEVSNYLTTHDLANLAAPTTKCSIFSYYFLKLIMTLNCSSNDTKKC